MVLDNGLGIIEHRSCGGGRFTCTRDPGPGKGGRGGGDGVRTNGHSNYTVHMVMKSAWFVHYMTYWKDPCSWFSTLPREIFHSVPCFFFLSHPKPTFDLTYYVL